MKSTSSPFLPYLFFGPLSGERARSLILAMGMWALIGPIAFADRATIDPTKTQIALPLSTPPTIDGIIDTDEWNRAGGFANDYWRVAANPDLSDGVLGGVVGAGTAPVDDDDLSFRIYVGYDNENLYVAVRVRDSVLQEDSAAADSMNGNTWEDDSVEVFVDGDNSNAARWAAGQPGGQYVITVNNAYRENEAGNPGYGPTAAWYAKTSKTDTGYDAEFRISLATLNNPKPGDIIGFTVAVNDDDDGAGTDRQIAWVGAAHEPVGYGNLMLNGRSYTAPKTAAPVIDGTINPSEYAGAAEIKVDGINGIYDNSSGDNTWEITDHAYSAWVVHDADAIYVAVNVTDDNIVTDTAEAGSEDGNTWEDDSVEIFFDANNSKDTGAGGGTEQFEGQYVLTANGAWRDNEARNPKFGQTDDWFAATTKTATGFAIEFKVKKSAILNPGDGTSVGFHIALNDDDGSLPAPKMQLGWSGYAHAEYTYGTLTLGGTSTPVGKLTINGNPDFGQTAVGGSGVERTFTIANIGTAPVNLSATPKVAITGPQASDFAVIAQPTAVIPVGGDSSVTIRFTPTGAGVRNATLSIPNDGDKNPFDLAITGSGTGAAAPLRIIEIKPDLGAGSITLRWEGEGPQFQVEKASTITGPFQSVGSVQSERVLTDAGVLKTNAQVFYRILQVSGPAPAPCSIAFVPETWANTPFSNQTGTFAVQFEATPSAAQMDSVMALSSGAKTAFSGFACLTRFNTTGNIDARNAGDYFADNVIPYSANVKYTFRLVVNIPAHTYSIYVTPAGGTEQTVGTDFAFRSDQSTVANLDHWGVVMTASGAAGTNTVCNFQLVPVVAPTVCSTASVPETWANTPFSNQTGTFTVQFEATPSAAQMDSVMALSSGAKTAFSGFACLTRFNTTGNIDARNAGDYFADNVIPYSANVKYTFRLVVNIPAHTYSIYVTPAGGTEQTVGTDFAFRSDQSTVANLDHWGVVMTASGAAGTNTVCNFRIL